MSKRLSPCPHVSLSGFHLKEECIPCNHLGAREDFYAEDETHRSGTTSRRVDTGGNDGSIQVCRQAEHRGEWRCDGGRPRTRSKERGSEHRERDSKDGVRHRERIQEDHTTGIGEIVISRSGETETVE